MLYRWSSIRRKEKFNSALAGISKTQYKFGVGGSPSRGEGYVGYGTDSSQGVGGSPRVGERLPAFGVESLVNSWGPVL